MRCGPGFRFLALLLGGAAALVALGWGPGAPGSPGRPMAAEPPDLVIAGVDVLDVRTGVRLRNRNVVVDDGWILRVEAASGRAPEAARVLEGDGGLLVPGFVDAHSHLGMLLGDSLSEGGGLITHLSDHPDSLWAYRERYAEQYLPWGVTAVRDMGSSAADISLLARWKQEPRPHFPDVFPAGGALVSEEEGRTPFPGHRVVGSPEDARTVVRGYHDIGLDQIKLYWRLREPEFLAALEEARRLGMHVTGHVDFDVLGFEHALDLGLRSFEHGYTLGVGALTREDYLAAWREHLPRWIGDRREGRFYLGALEYFSLLGPDDPEMARLIRRLAETGSTMAPTIHIFAQRLGLAPFESERMGAFDDFRGLTPDQLEHARRGYHILADYMRRLHEAGVTLTIGTDWVDPGKAVLSEMWLLNRAGISMADVLRMATLNGAVALGIEDRVGTVEAGKRANLVLLRGDPFEDPDALLGPRTVVKDGEVVVQDGPTAGDAAGDDAAGSEPPETEAPRLVVLLAVDQLGQGLLERYAPYLEGGLARLLREGAWFTDARVDHAVTVSHPGHVTLGTGLDPARHGIVDAAFYQGEPGARRFTEAVADTSERLLRPAWAPPVKTEERDAGGVSPRQIRAPGLWEWMAGPDVRRVAVATGRHASLLYARSPGDVYWFDWSVPGYVTSTFYRAELPEWVERFNARALPRILADTVWTRTAPEEAAARARRDDTPYESGGLHPSFPHRFHEEIPPEGHGDPRILARWSTGTPVPDWATLELARTAIRERRLGQRDVSDLLVIVVSQVDAIGHWYGPRSQESLENLLALDRALDAFLDELDEVVGRNRWALALSSDHSAPPAPEHRRASGERAERVGGEALAAAQAAVEQAVEAAGGDPGVRADAAAAAAEGFPWVADAMTPTELLAAGPPGDDYLRLYRNSYAPDRVPRYPLFSFRDGRSAAAREGIAVRLAPWAMLDLDTSVHGSPYGYDREIPVLFYGPGVAAGCRGERVTTRDVAPTLARLVGAPVPPELDGRTLEVGSAPEGSRPTCPGGGEDGQGDAGRASQP